MHVLCVFEFLSRTCLVCSFVVCCVCVLVCVLWLIDVCIPLFGIGDNACLFCVLRACCDVFVCVLLKGVCFVLLLFVCVLLRLFCLCYNVCLFCGRCVCSLCVFVCSFVISGMCAFVFCVLW